MADSNERKREDNNTGKAVRSSVGAFPGDTMASALDPFGVLRVLLLAERWTKRRGKVPIMTTIMVPKKEQN